MLHRSVPSVPTNALEAGAAGDVVACTPWPMEFECGATMATASSQALESRHNGMMCSH